MKTKTSSWFCFCFWPHSSAVSKPDFHPDSEETRTLWFWQNQADPKSRLLAEGEAETSSRFKAERPQNLKTGETGSGSHLDENKLMEANNGSEFRGWTQRSLKNCRYVKLLNSASVCGNNIHHNRSKQRACPCETPQNAANNPEDRALWNPTKCNKMPRNSKL